MLINNIETATHKTEKLVVHFQERYLRGKVKIKSRTLPGGYWNGSRVYDGYQKDHHVFCISVCDSGEGSSLMHLWLAQNKYTPISFEEINEV